MICSLEGSVLTTITGSHWKGPPGPVSGEVFAELPVSGLRVISPSSSSPIFSSTDELGSSNMGIGGIGGLGEKWGVPWMPSAFSEIGGLIGLDGGLLGISYIGGASMGLCASLLNFTGDGDSIMDGPGIAFNLISAGLMTGSDIGSGITEPISRS